MPMHPIAAQPDWRAACRMPHVAPSQAMRETQPNHHSALSIQTRRHPVTSLWILFAPSLTHTLSLYLGVPDVLPPRVRVRLYYKPYPCRRSERVAAIDTALPGKARLQVS